MEKNSPNNNPEVPMTAKEMFKWALETLLEGGAYITLFVLPAAFCVFLSLQSACSVL